MAVVPPARNDPDFDRLLAEHESAVKFYVRSLLPGFHSADDVAQEVLLTIWRKRDDFELGTNFKAWAFRIAQFHVLNQRRKLARGKWLMFDDEMIERLEPEWLAEESDALAAEDEALTHCLDSLKPDDLELLRTRYATKTSLETFAGQQGSRPGTLKARLFRLRATLRKCIEERLKSTE